MAESIAEATVGQWLKREGEAVAAGEVVLELETDKVNLEVTAAQGGRLEKIIKATGDTVGRGEVLGLIAEGASAPAQAAVPETAAAPVQAARQAQPAEAQGNGRAAEADATPVARRLAEAHAVDISTVQGSGRGGKITKEDIEAVVAGRGAAPAAEPAQQATLTPPAPAPAPISRPAALDSRTEERVRLSRRRLTIAQRLSEVSRDAVMTTTYNEVDMSAVMALRKRYREQFEKRHGTGLGFMSFFVKAVVGGLQAHPVINSELQAPELVYKRYYDIGIAVAAEDGLVVPVVRDADQKSFADIEAEIRTLATKAREKKLTLEDLRGGTFSITNGGVFGSLMSTPILNPPQVGILGMHNILERPIAIEGQVAIRPMMYLAVTYDHRVVEGADAVQFLVRIKQLIEDPARLLVDA